MSSGGVARTDGAWCLQGGGQATCPKARICRGPCGHGPRAARVRGQKYLSITESGGGPESGGNCSGVDFEPWVKKIPALIRTTPSAHHKGVGRTARPNVQGDARTPRHGWHTARMLFGSDTSPLSVSLRGRRAFSAVARPPSTARAAPERVDTNEATQRDLRSHRSHALRAIQRDDPSERKPSVAATGVGLRSMRLRSLSTDVWDNLVRTQGGKDRSNRCFVPGDGSQIALSLRP